MGGIDALLNRLHKVRKSGNGYSACCPAHDDRNPSLGITQHPDGRILIFCRAGCGGAEVMEAIGMSLADLYPDAPIRDYLPSAIGRKERSARQLETDIIKIVQCDMAAGRQVSAADAERAKQAAKRLQRLGRVD